MILFNRNDSLMSDLLTPTGGSNLTFKVSFDYYYFFISNDYLTFVTLAWSTKPVLSRWSIFVAIAIVWVKIIHFSFMPKIISILSKDHVPLIYFVNFLL